MRWQQKNSEYAFGYLKMLVANLGVASYGQGNESIQAS